MSASCFRSIYFQTQFECLTFVESLSKLTGSWQHAADAGPGQRYKKVEWMAEEEEASHKLLLCSGRFQLFYEKYVCGKLSGLAQGLFPCSIIGAHFCVGGGCCCCSCSIPVWCHADTLPGWRIDRHPGRVYRWQNTNILVPTILLKICRVKTTKGFKLRLNVIF